MDKVKKKFNQYPKQVQKEVSLEFRAWADDVAKDAKSNLQQKTSNTGALARSISTQYGNDFASVTVSANYAAYVEFGTRKFASEYVSSLPDNWKKMASSAKGGGGGNIDQFRASIMQWAKDRGIDQKFVGGIIVNILRNGIRPQPFLYPAVLKNTAETIRRIKKLLK